MQGMWKILRKRTACVHHAVHSASKHLNLIPIYICMVIYLSHLSPLQILLHLHTQQQLSPSDHTQNITELITLSAAWVWSVARGSWRWCCKFINQLCIISPGQKLIIEFQQDTAHTATWETRGKLRKIWLGLQNIHIIVKPPWLQQRVLMSSSSRSPGFLSSSSCHNEALHKL